MDSGSESDGAPEELTAVQVRLVLLTARTPDPRKRAVHDFVRFARVLEGGS
jgi:hypothetical protein